MKYGTIIFLVSLMFGQVKAYAGTTPAESTVEITIVRAETIKSEETSNDGTAYLTPELGVAIASYQAAQNE